MERLCQWFLYFTAYSFLGWCCECLYCALCDRKWVNRGFLNGPVCPVYGFGAVTVVALLTPFADSLPLLFLTGMAAASLLEYITAWLMETLFHAKWWDYSDYPFNLHGRVCLRNSLMFGVLSVVAMRRLHPAAVRLVARLSGWGLYSLSAALAAVFLADLVVSVRAVLALNGKLEQLEKLAAEVRAAEERRAALLRQEIRQQLEDRRERREARAKNALLALEEAAERLRARRTELAAQNRRAQSRLLAAFPRLRPHGRERGLEQLRQAFDELNQKRKNRRS